MPKARPKKNWKLVKNPSASMPKRTEINKFVGEWLQREGRKLSSKMRAQLVDNALVAFGAYRDAVAHKSGPSKKAVVAMAKKINGATIALLTAIEAVDDRTANDILRCAPKGFRAVSKLPPADVLKLSVAKLNELAGASQRVMKIWGGASKETSAEFWGHDIDHLFPYANPAKRFFGTLAYGYRLALSEEPTAYYHAIDEDYQGAFAHLAIELSELLPCKYKHSTVGKYCVEAVRRIKDLD
jgi:hypothetical protein